MEEECESLFSFVYKIYVVYNQLNNSVGALNNTQAHLIYIEYFCMEDPAGRETSRYNFY